MQSTDRFEVIFQTRFQEGTTRRAPPYFGKNIYMSHSYSIQHGTDNKIGLRLSVCVSVRLCVCPCVVTLCRISLSIFTKFDTKV